MKYTLYYLKLFNFLDFFIKSHYFIYYCSGIGIGKHVTNTSDLGLFGRTYCWIPSPRLNQKGMLKLISWKI